MVFFRTRELALLFVLVLATSAFAHERHVYNISGTPYLFVIGNLNEPIYTGDKTGLDLRVKYADPANITNSNSPNSLPVLGLEKTLHVTLVKENARQQAELEAAYGNPGAYKTTHYPSRPGHFHYHLTGTIDEKPIDLTFPCNEAGHHAAQTQDAPVTLSPNITLLFKSGAFACPLDREKAIFPPAPEPANRSNTRALIISTLALAATLALWLRRTV